MPADARLALAQRLRQFAHRQFSLRQQRQRTQPRGLARRAQCTVNLIDRYGRDRGESEI